MFFRVDVVSGIVIRNLIIVSFEEFFFDTNHTPFFVFGSLVVQTVDAYNCRRHEFFIIEHHRTLLPLERLDLQLFFLSILIY